MLPQLVCPWKDVASVIHVYSRKYNCPCKGNECPDSPVQPAPAHWLLPRQAHACDAEHLQRYPACIDQLREQCCCLPLVPHLSVSSSGGSQRGLSWAAKSWQQNSPNVCNFFLMGVQCGIADEVAIDTGLVYRSTMLPRDRSTSGGCRGTS